ncbi:MAG: lysylphosphatidylglycerol synthase transmembrane domain-containing protein, partial [Rickettsiales bacterium]
VVTLLGNLKWFVLLRSQVIDLDFKRSFWIYYMGYTFNYFLPGGVAGDVVKTGYIIKEGGKKSNSVLSILIDRIMGVFSMMLLIATLLPFFLNYLLNNDLEFINHYSFLIPYIIFVIALSSGLLAIFFYILRNKILYKKLLSFFRKKKQKSRSHEIILSVIKALFLYRNSVSAIVQNILIAAFIQILIGYCLFVIGSYILSGNESTVLSNIISSTITQLISIIPISPGGIGIGEAAFGKSMYYLNNKTLMSYATIYLIYRIYNIIFGVPAIAMFIFKRSKAKSNHKLFT